MDGSLFLRSWKRQFFISVWRNSVRRRDSIYRRRTFKYGVKKFSQRKTSKFITNIFGSALVTLVSLITFSIGLPVLYDKIIIGAIMPLVPGIALTTSIRDFFNGDYLSGAIHMIDAVLTAFCIAAGVGTVMTIYNLVVGGIL